MLPMLAAAAITAGVGAAGQAGLFGGPKQYGFTKEDIMNLAATRGNEIDAFSKELSDIRSQYMAQIPGLQMAAFQRFGGDAAAKLGANGIGVDSGAFASALARAAAPLQEQMYGTAMTTGLNNATAVDNARGSRYASTVGAQAGNTAPPQNNPLWAGLGNFAGQAAMAGLSQYGQPKQQPKLFVDRDPSQPRLEPTWR